VKISVPNPFQGMGAWRNSMGTKQSGHIQRSGLEAKNGGRSVKDGAPERLRCGTIQKVSKILRRVSAGAARKILLQF